MNSLLRLIRKYRSPTSHKVVSRSAVPARSMFRQADLNEMIARDGCATFQWLSEAEMTGLIAVVQNAAEGVDFSDVHIPTNFRLSAFTNDATYKSNLYDSVFVYLKDKLDELLPNYLPLVINVFEKFPESGYDPVPIHQNPSFVQEPQHKSISLWIPLQDVTKANGTLGVLRGSHDRFNPMRAGNMPHADVFKLVREKLEQERFEPLNLRRGQIAALDDSIIHWSYPNISNSTRSAVQLIMVPKDAQHIYYFYNVDADRPVMDLYKVDKEFFFNFNCNERPEGLTKLDSVPYTYTPISENDLLLSSRQ